MKYLVIKIGGSLLASLPETFYEDVVKIQTEKEWVPIIVHGGGPLISSLLTQFKIPSQFVKGLRVTTEEMLDIVEMALSGSINKQITRNLTKYKGKAVGVSGIDGFLLEAKPSTKALNLGYVGEVSRVHAELLMQLTDLSMIPVISPLGMDALGQRYNINADDAATAIAKRLNATLCLITDVKGVYEEINQEKVYYHHLSKQKALQMIDDGLIHGGMIPKVQGALEALKSGISQVAILSGFQQHSLIEFTQCKRIGTTFQLEEEQ